MNLLTHWSIHSEFKHTLIVFIMSSLANGNPELEPGPPDALGACKKEKYFLFDCTLCIFETPGKVWIMVHCHT